MKNSLLVLSSQAVRANMRLAIHAINLGSFNRAYDQSRICANLFFVPPCLRGEYSRRPNNYQIKRVYMRLSNSFFALLIGCLLICFSSVHAATQVALKIDSPVAALGRAWPLYVGVPFPKDTFRDAQQARVIDAAGNPVPAQTRVKARWPNSDAIRWLGVDFVGDPSQSYRFEFGPEITAPKFAPDTPRLTLKHTEKGIELSTGPALFLLPTTGPLIARAWLDLDGNGRFDDSERILSSEQGELYAIDQEGRLALSGADPQEPDTLTLEPGIEDLHTQGSALHVAVRREGWYTTGTNQERVARHITRLHFYAGKSFVRIEHTFVMTRNTTKGSYAERRNKAPPIWFRDLGIRFDHALSGERVVTFADDSEAPDHTARFRQQAGDSPLFMFQEKAFYFNHMDPHADCRFVIGRDEPSGATVLKEGERCGDWVVLQNARAGVALGIRNLWQQYPKELQVSENSLSARLWSNRGGRELDFRLETYLTRWPTNWFNPILHGDYGDAYNAVIKKSGQGHALGMAKTHELLLFLLPGRTAGSQISPTLQTLSQPVTVLADPDWLYRTEAMSPLYPRDTQRFPLAEAYMENFFDHYMSVIRTWGDYGFLDFGAGPHVWYRVGKSESFKDRWFPYLFRFSPSIDYGFHTHLWRMYARSGQRKYLDYAEETNRQRMDLCMVHWDEPGISFTTKSGTLYGKYRGAFSAAMNVFPWSPYSQLHHNSGTDLRQLYWFDYLRDYRRAREVADSYHTLINRLWDAGSTGPFTGTRPFATLKNLGTLYQETGDPKILQIGRERLAALVDLKSPQAVTPHLATGLAKYGTKIGAVERWYEATGDELAAQALLRGADTYARTSMGNVPHTYYNVLPRVLNRAYRITENSLYARILKRNQDMAVAMYHNVETDQWTLSDTSAISMSNSAYPLGDMALGMDAIVRAGDLGPVPVLQQTGPGETVYAILQKPARRQVTLDLRGRVPLTPRLFTLDGKPVETAILKPFREELYSLELSAAPRFFDLQLPAELAEGTYLLDAGAGGLPWEVTWTDASQIVLYIPNGLSEGCGSTWVGRYDPKNTPEAAPLTWYFQVPAHTGEFTILHSSAIELRNPLGQRVPIESKQPQTTIAVPAGQDDAFWSFIARRPAHIELRGVPPVVASSPDHFFLPSLEQIPPTINQRIRKE